jgi:hypothetical protein
VKLLPFGISIYDKSLSGRVRSNEIKNIDPEIIQLFQLTKGNLTLEQMYLILIIKFIKTKK